MLYECRNACNKSDLVLFLVQKCNGSHNCKGTPCVLRWREYLVVNATSVTQYLVPLIRNIDYFHGGILRKITKICGVQVKIDIQHDCVVIKRSHRLCKWRENASAKIACERMLINSMPFLV